MTDAMHDVRKALIRRMPVSDAAFDALYPDELRPLSRDHWTPIAVALRATEMLAPAANQRVLDVGSGVGKMCIVGALTFPASWYGIERDRSQVMAARQLARQMGIGDATFFLCGELDSLEWGHFDGFYLFNPAGSALVDTATKVPFVSLAMVASAVRKIEQELARARPGTRVVTYHGFGGVMPPSFELEASETIEGGKLQLWIQGRPRRRRPHETGDLAA